MNDLSSMSVIDRLRQSLPGDWQFDPTTLLWQHESGLTVQDTKMPGPWQFKAYPSGDQVIPGIVFTPEQVAKWSNKRIIKLKCSSMYGVMGRNR